MAGRSTNTDTASTDDVLGGVTPPTKRAAEARPRLVVELSQKTAVLLDELVELEELNKTTVVNRAIQVYSILRKAEEHGGQVLLAEREGDQLSRVRFI